MFIEVTPETREYVLSQGEVEFSPAVKWKAQGTDVLHKRYDITFVYPDGKKDELGKFYLTLREDYCYEMTYVELTTECGKPLQMFMLELIMKTAIKEAKTSGVGRLDIECNHAFAPDAFLTCHFKVERLDIVSPGKTIWKGSKEIAQDKQHPLVNFAKGMGSL